MKRAALVRHPEERGCWLLREGGRHSVFFNPETRRTSIVPRHREVDDFLARKICRDLGIPKPPRTRRPERCLWAIGVYRTVYRIGIASLPIPGPWCRDLNLPLWD